jgi:hypothetical protein
MIVRKLTIFHHQKTQDGLLDYAKIGYSAQCFLSRAQGVGFATQAP